MGLFYCDLQDYSTISARNCRAQALQPADPTKDGYQSIAFAAPDNVSANVPDENSK